MIQDLFEAITNNDLKAIQDLIENQHADINQKNEVCITPLHLAFMDNKIEIMYYLAQNGGRLDYKGYLDKTIEIWDNDPDQMEDILCTYTFDLLKKFNEKINDDIFSLWCRLFQEIVDYHIQYFNQYFNNSNIGSFIINQACEHKKTRVLKFLLDNRKDIQEALKPHSSGYPLLLKAAVFSNLETVKSLVEHYNLPINQEVLGFNAIHAAAGNYCINNREFCSSKNSIEETIKIIQYLVANGADINQKTDSKLEIKNYSIVFKNYYKGGFTPLHLAVASFANDPPRQLQVIETLLSLMANPNIQDRNGNTPLHLVYIDFSHLAYIDSASHPPANLNNNELYVYKTRLIKLLLNAKADRNKNNYSNFTPEELLFTKPIKIEFLQQLLKQDVINKIELNPYDRMLTRAAYQLTQANSYKFDSTVDKQQWVNGVTELLKSMLKGYNVSKETKRKLFGHALTMSEKHGTDILLNILYDDICIAVNTKVRRYENLIKDILDDSIDTSNYHVKLVTNKSTEVIPLKEALIVEINKLISTYTPLPVENIYNYSERVTICEHNPFSISTRDFLSSLLPKSDNERMQKFNFESRKAEQSQLNLVINLIKNISKINTVIFIKQKSSTSDELKIEPYSVELIETAPLLKGQKLLTDFWRKSNRRRAADALPDNLNPDEPKGKRVRLQ